MKDKNRTSRISFCEWSSQTNGAYNTGGIICQSCNFSRTLKRGEKDYTYQTNNKIDREADCPNCKGNNWYWLPPIARVPRKNATKAIWKKFWQMLKDREFNHPEWCR